MQTSPRFYYPELDGLRFIAFMLVFIHNANPILQGTFLEKFSEYSWFGVDLFFCLSAFLITKLLVTEHEQTGKINIRNFYVRRALRIWPAYFAFILFSISVTQNNQGWSTNLLTRAAGLATFTDNFVSAVLGLNFISYSVQLWTISFEEQYYALFPWITKWIVGMSQKSKMIVIGMVFAVGFVIRGLLIYFRATSTAIYVLPFTHFESVLAGILLGLNLFNAGLNKIKTPFLFLLGVLCFSVVFQLPNKEVVGWNLMLTYPLVGLGALFTVFAIHKDSRISSLINFPFVNYLGKISYGLYIYHLLGLVLVTNFISYQMNFHAANLESLNIIIFLIALLFTASIAHISYRILEKPFLEFKEKYSIIPSRPI